MIPVLESPSLNSFRYYRDLTWHLVQRDFILRYKGSFLGVLWILIVPLMQLLTLVFVFRRVVPLGIDSYPAFVFTALLPWTWFSNSLSSAGNLFTGNKDLVRHPNFSPWVLITVNTFSNLLLYFTVLPLVFGMLFVYGHKIGITIVFLPLLLVIQSLLIEGLSFMIATWNVFYRDVQQIVGVFLTLMFWITPVFYKSRAVDPRYQFLFDVNPVAVLIKGYREVLFYSESPAWGGIIYSTIVSIVLAYIGYQVYQRKIHKVIDAL